MFGLKISIKQVLYKDHINKHKGFHEDIKKKNPRRKQNEDLEFKCSF
jgi:hypothetical protein